MLHALCDDSGKIKLYTYIILVKRFNIVYNNCTSNNLSLLGSLGEKTGVNYFEQVVGTDYKEILADFREIVAV